VLVRVLIVALLLLTGACNKAGKNGAISADLPEVQRVDPAPAPAKKQDKESLYAACKDRVENPQEAGECTADADCARTGCGSEVCTTSAAAKGFMTTCDARYCYQVLDTCGCHEGVCSWTLKDPGPKPPPNRLPPM
jgi:eight-cysteine-cluster-containing protein